MHTGKLLPKYGRPHRLDHFGRQRFGDTPEYGSGAAVPYAHGIGLCDFVYVAIERIIHDKDGHHSPPEGKEGEDELILRCIA
ncbi:MAG: hypothetical protein JXA08_10185 [Methanomicrobiaceae archaeon]|nr:hypothetical protein [Methanomicrobiaceae archaeon]